jgi:predicted acylesterase/phospholipase RssA
VFGSPTVYSSVSYIWKEDRAHSFTQEEHSSVSPPTRDYEMHRIPENDLTQVPMAHAGRPLENASKGEEARGNSEQQSSSEFLKNASFTSKPCSNTIKHIVISGGSEAGLSFYSALRDSNKSDFWNIQNIETVYGTSIGSMVAIMITLLPFFNWDIYDDFIIKRPWHHIFDFHIKNIIPSIKQKGIFTKKVIEDVMSPLFGALDISLNITMLDFFYFTKIELHMIATDISNFELVDISHKTHPEWKVIDAIYCSACLPILFVPFTIGDDMYIDGGILSNYPVNKCIENGSNPDEILGITRVYSGEKKNISINTMIDYIFFIIGSLLSKVSIKPTKIKNQIEIVKHDPFVNIYNVYKYTSQKAQRIQLLELGTSEWNAFYEKTYTQISPTPDA